MGAHCDFFLVLSSQHHFSRRFHSHPPFPLLIFHAQLDMGPARPTKLHSVPVKIEKDGPANVDKLVTSVI